VSSRGDVERDELLWVWSNRLIFPFIFARKILYLQSLDPDSLLLKYQDERDISKELERPRSIDWP
jgi:hypothetical protein